MASITKMSIQGIRSFGPDDSDRQVIHFFTPVTLILGDNGTGKTTIIESLKYSTTGEFPPGAGRGQAFVHDPKIANEPLVRGQVRLQFQDVQGKICIVQRTIEAQQKAKQITFRQLEGLITRKRADGSKVSTSSKCVEIDREMVQSLGVSKPILQNVIFCHQEDSNWPLSEGKALKQKFDDIFASTRYVKALDTIQKFKKEQVVTIKQYQTEIKFLKQNKEKAAEHGLNILKKTDLQSFIMASITKMSIQGIRSFGPDDSDRQVIHFFTPVTLILGDNGTGKTTIIESLKYSTTGEFPPGAGRGQAFVHDPKIANEPLVRGQVRLQFQDVQGKICIVQRTIEAQQKAKQITFRQLEGLITRKRADGSKVSTSSKCVEIDREMVQSLGVSKPILQNVIFCHQEDSNWPLSEGKALKQKFDDIFASTRYVKALDTIQKFKKEQVVTIKQYQTEIKFLKQNKEKAAEIQLNLTDTLARFEASKESVVKIREKLKPIEERLDHISSKSADIYKLNTKVEKLASEKHQMEKSYKELRESIENEFTGTTEALRRELSEFSTKVKRKQDELKKIEAQLLYSAKEIEKKSQQKSSLLVEQGRLAQAAERQEDNIRQRNALIRKIADVYGFEGFSAGSITEEKLARFQELMSEKYQEYMAEAREIKAQFEEREMQIQQKLDELRDSKTKMEQSERMKNDLIRKNETEIRSIRQELSRVDASAGKLEGIDTDLKRTEHELSEAENGVNLDELRSEISDLQRKKTELDKQHSNLSAEMSRMHLQSSAQTQLDMLRKEKVQKEDLIKKLKSKHEDALIHLLGHVPATNVKGTVEHFIAKQSNEVSRMRKVLDKENKEMASKEATRKMIVTQVKEKEDELRGHEEKVFEIGGSQNFDEGLSNLQSRISDLQDEKGALIGSSHFFNKFINKLRRNDPQCPLCHRGFDEQQEVDELIEELQNLLSLVPSKVEKTEEELGQHQQRYDSMLQLKPVRTTISKLADQVIPDLKNKQRVLSEQIDKLQQSIAEKDEDLQEKESDEVTAKSILPEIVQLDRCQKELQELERKIGQQMAKMGTTDSSRTMQQVNNEKEEAQMQLDTVNRTLDHKRQKLSDHSEQLQQLKSSINELKGEKLQIERDLQQRLKLEERRAELASANQAAEREIKEARNQLQPLMSQLEKYRKDKDEITRQKEEKNEEKSREARTLEDKRGNVKSIQKEIVRYTQEGLDRALNDTEIKLADIQEKLGSAQQEQESLNGKINKIKEDLTTQQVSLDTVNRTLDHKRQKLSDHSEQLQQLKSSINELKGEKLQIERDLQQRLKLEERRAELASVNQAAEREIKEARNQLQPLMSQLEKYRKEKDEITRQKEEKNEEKSREARTLEDKRGNVKSIQKEIVRYTQEGLDRALNDTEIKLADIQEKLGSAQQEQESLNGKINKIKEDLTTQQVKERELNDNLSLRNKEDEITAVTVKIEELREQLGGLDATNLERERRKLNEEYETLTKEKHQKEGRQHGLEEQIRQFRRELKDDMYKDADVKYRDKMIVLRTTELANLDLEKYYMALDRAIMSYHKSKMEELNKIIRELWRTTYRGTDIETIEIRSEDDGTGISKSKRSYNYRVVMIKGGTPIDMRGRCSAGQKVLASLLIRLALAETFCINCGILALDEPTTNLDRANIESLAYALVEIIKSRCSQRNFQLVVITHDEDFVSLLGKCGYVGEIYRIKKNEQGNSTIAKALVRDLM
ncbi:DNA repair protein RAD50 [Lingula anatina]|uniref:DNA repair protein RAD50 n=1 Tax=Lingula anatina TaxID=7574 RepID=A0A1S3IZI9_LINAN|nr:DNA repair protein RAD50 [Lingula anatina]|eukprot:XP_013403610.1 DNA repair protein RAD50 [Lingula anatina]